MNYLYSHIIKRLSDIIISFLLIIILSPLMLIVALLIRLESKGGALFIQKRIGKNEKEFKILKFRSMCMGAEQMGTGVYSCADDMRVTRVGRIIRALSIDELPQLFNIFKGDMSFIGPRPPLTYHPWAIDEYTSEQRRMFDVRPGITGWAQINGRKEVEWHERIRLNVWYVDHISLRLDIKILFLTVFKVLSNADNVNTKETLAPDSGAQVKNKI